ncbi:MAG: hypothetical protein PHU88_08720 [candidate division Zixibacteria bacterium]|nr:hypothetical protein [candidate division Zixibacteria bacterium]MDD5425028.1 hypothetical protein [candidate division Zixibacteria bacterium]
MFILFGMKSAYFYAHESGNPYFNMAFDEWLLSRAVKEPGTVFLRLYRWQLGAITFGFNQHRETAIDFSRLDGTPVIRRITGGRAIYHDPSEYTYALALNSDGLENTCLNGSLSATSRAIAGALVHFLCSLGIVTDYVRKSSRENARPDFFHKAPCFASRARYELVSENNKIVASAQKRFGTSLLQHGSIKLFGVITHPALDNSITHPPSNHELLAGKEFKEISHIFLKVMSNFFNLDITPVKNYPEEELRVLRQMENFIKKNALSKRHVLNK